MIRMNHAGLLRDALQGTGFVRRGSAFFRVWGDGVLQVLKFERQRVGRVHDLKVGIFSMYGEMHPTWFTSSGCVPRGSIASFIGLRFVDGLLAPTCLTKTDRGQFFYNGFPISIVPDQRLWDAKGEYWSYYLTPEQQIHILKEKTLPWLNEITTQSLAAKAMFEIWPVSNDDLQFDAHLAAGEWEQAEQAMSAILKQHADARANWKEHCTHDKFVKLVEQQETRDVPLKAALKMVQEKDKDTISSYLSDNYKRNCKLAKFCMK